MKFPLESKKKYQLKKRLTPIKKQVMQLANPKILMKTKMGKVKEQHRVGKKKKSLEGKVKER